jgi:hypothetical protein
VLLKELGERQDIAVRVGVPGHLVAAGRRTSRHGHRTRNLAIAILRLTGHASIAAALRYHARQPGRPLQTIMQC